MAAVDALVSLNLQFGAAYSHLREKPQLRNFLIRLACGHVSDPLDYELV